MVTEINHEGLADLHQMTADYKFELGLKKVAAADLCNQGLKYCKTARIMFCTQKEKQL